MSVHAFLLTIASQLGDARPGGEFRRYLLRDLVTYYNEAMCFVATHRPDLFVKHSVIKLQTGSLQDASCCGCTSNLRFYGQIDADGNTIKDVMDLVSSSTGTTSSKTKWYRAPCKATADGQGSVTLISNIIVEPGANGLFSVSPPVKPGENVWLRISCSASPCALSEGDVLAGAAMSDCTWQPALRSYILYRALQGDRHAVGASVEAQNELKNVYQYLNLKYKMEQEIEGQ